MTANNLTTNKPEPKYRKKLNQEQIAVLQLLYRFRFASSDQIAKIQEKPAAYYLTSKGARALEANTNRKPDEPINIKRIYKEKDVSECFIEHSKNVLNISRAQNTLSETR